MSELSDEAERPYREITGYFLAERLLSAKVIAEIQEALRERDIETVERMYGLRYVSLPVKPLHNP